MKHLIVANWKCNPTTAKEAKQLFDAVKKSVKGSKAEIVICPPFVYLPLRKGLPLGAQNAFYKEKGAFTGEVSPLMLKDLKVKYVILGHSEVRKYLNETDEMINQKIKAVLKENLIPILCVGENEGENKFEVLQKQISKALDGVSSVKGQMSNVIIAYEPVWAIGTGRNCSVEETADSFAFIKKIISKLYGEKAAESAKILYGGSVKAENSGSYVREAGANGLLVGGASLNARDFTSIVKSVE